MVAGAFHERVIVELVAVSRIGPAARAGGISAQGKYYESEKSEVPIVFLAYTLKP